MSLAFKDIYHEKVTGSSTTTVWTSSTPRYEVREINTVWALTSAAGAVGTLMRQDKSGAIERYFHRGDGPYIQWRGKLLFPEGNRIRVLWDTLGNVELHVIGVTRYLEIPRELEKVKPDLQVPEEKWVPWWPL